MSEPEYVSRLKSGKETAMEQKYRPVWLETFTGSSSDLTLEEIFDINQYFSGSEETKKFSNINDFLKDLHE